MSIVLFMEQEIIKLYSDYTLSAVLASYKIPRYVYMLLLDNGESHAAQRLPAHAGYDDLLPYEAGGSLAIVLHRAP